MHKHHHCECQHERIKFCKQCHRPYCLDCGQEWYAHSWYYTWTTPTYYTTPTIDTTPSITYSDHTIGDESGKCINCGVPCQPWNWFCDECVKVKEKAYAQSAQLGEPFHEVIARREEALRLYREYRKG